MKRENGGCRSFGGETENGELSFSKYSLSSDVLEDESSEDLFVDVVQQYNTLKATGHTLKSGLNLVNFHAYLL